MSVHRLHYVDFTGGSACGQGQFLTGSPEWVDCIHCLRKALTDANSALVSVSIERDHFKTTVKELTYSGRYDGGTEERGLKDMAGFTI